MGILARPVAACHLVPLARRSQDLRARVSDRTKKKKKQHISLGIQFCNLSDFISISNGTSCTRRVTKKKNTPPLPRSTATAAVNLPNFRIFTQSDSANDSDHLDFYARKNYTLGKFFFLLQITSVLLYIQYNIFCSTYTRLFLCI